MSIPSIRPRAIAVVLLAVVLGVVGAAFVWQRAVARTAAVEDTALLVAQGLDDQALVLALQHERWQADLQGDRVSAEAATDALIDVRSFDADLLTRIDEARSDPSGFDAILEELIARSGAVDPGLLDGSSQALAQLNAAMIHWRGALADELALVVDGASTDDVQEARQTTSDWTTTLRRTAPVSHADAVERETGSAVLEEIRDRIDAASSTELGRVVGDIWIDRHLATSALAAEVDRVLWSEQQSARDAARRSELAYPAFMLGAMALLIAAGSIVRRRDGADEVLVPPVAGAAELADSAVAEADPPAPEARSSTVDPDTEVEPEAVPFGGFGDLFGDERGSKVDRPMAAVVATAAGRADDPALAIGLLDRTVVSAEVVGDVGAIVAAVAGGIRAAVGPESPIEIIGNTHDLGYLLWVVPGGDAIDDATRQSLNLALGGGLEATSDVPGVGPLATAGEIAGSSGVDIELLEGDEDTTLVRIFVPARHLVATAPTIDLSQEAEPAEQRPDPLRERSAEPLSKRLARLQRPAIDEPSTPASEPLARPRRPVVAGETLRPLDLVLDDEATGTDPSHQDARDARRRIEHYRGGVGAALMDAADDIVLSARTLAAVADAARSRENAT